MAQRMNFTDANVEALEVRESKYEVHNTKVPNLLVRVERSGRKTFYLVYGVRGRTRWFRIGPSEMGAALARTRAKELIGDIARGRDPQAERAASNSAGVNFEQLHARYLEEHAKRHNKSWRQGDANIRKYVLPQWGKLKVSEISRSHVKALVGKLTANNGPILSNQVRFSVSAVFKFAVKEEIVTVNPCAGVDLNPTNERKRILADSEVKKFWDACEQHVDPVRASALRAILLTGQRPGEIANMRREHIKDGFGRCPANRSRS